MSLRRRPNSLATGLAVDPGLSRVRTLGGLTLDQQRRSRSKIEVRGKKNRQVSDDTDDFEVEFEKIKSRGWNERKEILLVDR